MPEPLIHEKLGTPAPPTTYLSRPRLDQLWNTAWKDKQLVEITAAAGYGKTAFLAARARTHPGECTWYTLDEMDQTLPTFCAHLQASLPAVGARAGDPDSSGLGSTTDFLAAVLRRLRNPAKRRVLVFDNAHCLNRAPATRAFLGRLCRYLPTGNLLVLSGREPVALPPARGPSYGCAAELTTRQLAFTPEETATLLRRWFQADELDPSLAGKVSRMTGGWPVGLEILLRALPSRAPDAVREALRHLARPGIGWSDYFANDIWAHVNEETRSFLLRTSPLPRLEPQLCNRLLGIEDSAEQLEQLAQRNLFTFRAQEKERVYRVHPLFRSFLRGQLRQCTPERELRRWHRRVARLLAHQGLRAEAVSLFAEGGDHEASLRLIDRSGEDLLASGEHEAVRRALSAIPARDLERHPNALYLKGRLLDVQGDWEAAEAIYRRLLRRRPGRPIRVDLMSTVAQLLSRRGAYRKAVAISRKGLSDPGPKSVRTRGRLLITIGVAACELGHVADGERYLRRAQLLFRRNGDRAGEARVDYLRASNVDLPAGAFQRARKHARRALATARQQGLPRHVCVSLTVLAWAELRGGRVREARRLAEQALSLAEELGQRSQAGLATYLLGCCDTADGDLDRAPRRLRTAMEVGDTLRETDLETLPRLALAECALRSKNPIAAREYGRRAVTLARANRDPLQECQGCLLLGRVADSTGNSTARGWWRKAEQIARRIGATYEWHHCLLLRLAARHLSGTVARRALRDLLRGVGRCGHSHLLLTIERNRGVWILVEALRRDTEVEYAMRLLARFGPESVPAVASLLTSDRAGVRSRAVVLLGQIGGAEARAALAQISRHDGREGALAARAIRELTRPPAQPLEIHALGPLRISLGDRQVTRSDWRSRRALRAFELLLAHRFRWIPRDQVLEALWPDEPVEKASNNLWQSIHQLRRLLQPELRRARDSSYVRYQNEAYRLVPGEQSRYDVIAFEAAQQRGESAWQAGSLTRAEPELLAALQLYRGDFLEESPYEDYSAIEREQLRDRLIRTLHRLLALYSQQQRWVDAMPLARRGLQQDPYQEGFHFHLMHAQLSLGQRREALEAYRRYERQMIREMGLRPSERMRQLAERVTAR